MRILFTSWHFYLDQSNGASISARELLRLLRRQPQNAWETYSFCGPATDAPERYDVESILKNRRIEILNKSTVGGTTPFSTLAFKDDGVNSIAFCPVDRSVVPSYEVGRAFLNVLSAVLKRINPDVVVSYGGYWLGSKTLELCRRSGAKTVVLLQNFAYREAEYFQNADCVVVPSLYASNVYRERLGLNTVVLPPPIDWENVLPRESAEDSQREYLLFVNPTPNKGVYFFARLVKELWKRRPDIRSLVVEGSASPDILQTFRALLAGAGNVSGMTNTYCPSLYYGRAKATLVPSFFDESFGRVAAESLGAGVPVLASDRGALPETLGNAARLFEIPKEYTPETRIVPPANVVEPWLEEIIMLWDDREYYQTRRQMGLEHAKIWESTRLAFEYDKCFRCLAAE